MKMLEQVWLNADDTLRGVTELAQKDETQPWPGASQWCQQGTWGFNSVRGVQTRMKKLEQVRLEVDSRRHTVSQLAQKIEKQRAKLTAAGDRQKSEETIETTIRRMQHKENKLAGARRRPSTHLEDSHCIMYWLMHPHPKCSHWIMF